MTDQLLLGSPCVHVLHETYKVCQHFVVTLKSNIIEATQTIGVDVKQTPLITHYIVCRRLKGRCYMFCVLLTMH